MNILLKVAELIKSEKTFALATLVYADSGTPRKLGSRMIVYPDGKIEGSIGGGTLELVVIKDALKLLAAGENKRFQYDLTEKEGENPLGMACGGKAEILIETFQKKDKLFVFGAGHIGKKLAELSRIIEIPCWVIDNREEYAREVFFPEGITVLHDDFLHSFSQLPIDEKSYIVIVTHGHTFDKVCLREALKTKAQYIGMIGSKNKVRGIKNSLVKEGVDINDPRIYSPIGLQIGNYTPGEIAVSIVAEILKVKSGGNGKHLRDIVQTLE